MKSNLDIRSLYHPVQPAVKGVEENISYREMFPDQRLQQFIYCYWFLSTNEQLLTPYTYNVVADGCIDIVFNRNDPSENYIMGFCDQNNEFVIDGFFRGVGVRFFPSIFPVIFKTDATDFHNRLAPLNLFLKSPSQFIEDSFSPIENDSSIKDKLDNYFLKVIADKSIEIDFRFQAALDVIFRNRGVINLQTDLDIGLSQRQLRRYFDLYIGSSPKSFSQVVRFQNILKTKPSVQSLRENKLFYDFGYYDQAHFINEFKRFYGSSPVRSLR